MAGIIHRQGDDERAKSIQQSPRLATEVYNLPRDIHSFGKELYDCYFACRQPQHRRVVQQPWHERYLVVEFGVRFERMEPQSELGQRLGQPEH